MGVTQDFKQAKHWYRQAADQGHAAAQCSLALMHNHGQGTQKNPLQAYIWALFAVENGEKKCGELRDIVAKTLTAEQQAEGQRRVSEWFDSNQ